MRYLIGGEHVACRWSTLTNSLGKQQLELSTKVMLLEAVANLCTSQHQAFIFELGGISKHLMTGPMGNSEFCFPETLNVHGPRLC